MGASFLSRPIKTKISEDKSNEKLSFGVSSMQGWRDNQEDAHNCILDFDDDTSFFAIYDGHGGREVAVYASQEFPKFLRNTKAYRKNLIKEALIEAFLGFDDTLVTADVIKRLEELAIDNDQYKHGLEKYDEKKWIKDKEDRKKELAKEMMQPGYKTKCGYESGCAALVALIRGDDLYIANIGDSRCVISKKGAALVMSHQHKPTDDIEYARIKKAGGELNVGRIEGLNLSRAFGDYKCKRNKKLPNTDQMVTALPDVKVIKLEPEIDFIVLACDGIWDCKTPEAVVDFIRTRIQANQKLSTICEDLFSACLLKDGKSCHFHGGIGCDNMSCIIIKRTT